MCKDHNRHEKREERFANDKAYQVVKSTDFGHAAGVRLATVRFSSSHLTRDVVRIRTAPNQNKQGMDEQ